MVHSFLNKSLDINLVEKPVHLEKEKLIKNRKKGSRFN